MLIDRLMLVSASEFTSAIIRLLTEVLNRGGIENQPIALYAEREVEKDGHVMKPFFPGTSTGRAIGDGVPPVLANPDIGSEGILATLISKFCKSNPDVALSHPGPDQLRSSKTRRIVIVTDFIGSGRRISEMLDAFAKVATLQSWRSYKLLSFEVVCYSGTEDGLAFVRQHSLSPLISSHIACPVIDEAFKGHELGAVKILCRKYPKKSKSPFGFSGTGSLIAFSHGIPNNAPPILHSKASGWKPLFQGRSTLAASLDTVADSAELIEQNSQKVLGIRNARKVLSDPTGELWVHTMLVLDAVRAGQRSTSKVSAHTQIPMARTEEIFNLAFAAGWLTNRNSLTSLGRRELKQMKWVHPSEDWLALSSASLYFPTQLRAQ